jgi:hypothetical protein
MGTRILFADDQIPSERESDNKKVLRELEKELEGTLTDAAGNPKRVSKAYDEDREWFSELIKSLREQGFELILARTVREAEAQIRAQDYDVAIIDLEWTGDSDVPSPKKSSRGVALIEQIAEEDRNRTRHTPVIAFSQKFKKKPELVATAQEKLALPIQKVYDEVGLRTLAAAVKLLAKLTLATLPTTMVGVGVAQAGTELATRRQAVKSAGQVFNRLYLACFVFLFVLAIGLVLFPAVVSRERFLTIAPIFGVGGGSMLLWAWRAHNKAQASLDAYWMKI